MKQSMGSVIFVGLGWLSLVVGFIGIFLPILPTVPFVILAAYCFSKGSPKLHGWLRNHPRFGQALRSWEDYGVIRRRAKWMATIFMAAGLVYPIGFGKMHAAVKVFVVVSMLGVLGFIWTRPNEPGTTERT